MDIKIEKKKGIHALFTKKGLPYIAGALFIVFVLWLIFRDNSSTLRVDSKTISIAEVKKGEFNDGRIATLILKRMRKRLL